MKDSDIRKIILSNLSQKYKNDPETRIIEIGLCQGEARVDIAVVNGSIHGYEIKSNQDTLKRLAGQVVLYSRTLDYITLIAGDEHLDEAIRIIPEWWGVIEAKKNKKNIKLHKIRASQKNPILDPEAIIQLIWRDEALEVLRKRGLHKGCMSKTKWFLWERIIDKLSLDELRKEVRMTLKSRENWRFVQPQK